MITNRLRGATYTVSIISTCMVPIGTIVQLHVCKGFRDGGSSGTAYPSYCNISINTCIISIRCFIFWSLTILNVSLKEQHWWDITGPDIPYTVQEILSMMSQAAARAPCSVWTCIVRCMKRGRFSTSFKESADSCPGTGRCIMCFSATNIIAGKFLPCLQISSNILKLHTCTQFFISHFLLTKCLNYVEVVATVFLFYLKYSLAVF